MPNRAGVIDRRLEELTVGGFDRVEEPKPRMVALVGFIKRVGEKVAALAEGDGQPPAASRAGRLPPRGSADVLLRHPRRCSRWRCSRCSRASILMRPNLLLALGGLGFGYLLPGMVLARHGQAARPPDPPVAGRHARPAGRQRRGRARPRPGDLARRRRAGVRLSRALRRAAADQPGAARRQAAGRRRCATWPTAPASTTSARSSRC